MAQEQGFQVLQVRANNASAYTLEGTNSWVLGTPGCTDAILIDPGPDDPIHLSAVEAMLRANKMHVRDVILTHAHDDHLGNLWRIVVRDPDVRVHSLFHGYPEHIQTGWGTIRVIRTPGHTHDSVSIWDEYRGALFVGDMVLGDGPTMIDYPDGSVGDYFESLEHLLGLPGLTMLYPGHGDVRTDPYVALDWNLEHRKSRVTMIEPFIERFAADAELITSHCYVGLSPQLYAGALQNTQAALEYLLRDAIGSGDATRDRKDVSHGTGEA